MNNKYLKPVFIAATIVLIIFFFLLYSTFSQNRNPDTSNLFPTSSPSNTSIDTSSYIFTPLQKTIIGKTTEEEVNKLPVIKKEILENQMTKYTIKSNNPLETDEVILKDSIVVYEATIVITPEVSILPTISSYKQQFGEPEEEISGSPIYGAHATVFSYSQKGFLLIGNKNTDEVYEVRRFLPTTLTSVRQQYSPDLTAVTPGPEIR